MTPETIGTQLQSLPAWLRPILGLLAIPLFVLSLPIMIPLAIGMMVWDSVFTKGSNIKM